MSPPAETFAGRYVAERQIARGGMGRVLLAQDRLLGRRVALKTVLDPRSPDLLLRFVEEAQLTGQLAHPNVVPVHELGCEGKAPFLAMKLVEGQDLGALLARLAKDEQARAEWPLPRLLRAFIQTCEGVAHAHARGVIHRDLKPANLMLGPADEVLVLDWGLARPVEGTTVEQVSAGSSSVTSLAREVIAASGEVQDDGSAAGITLSGSIVGTPAYMPPEQAASEPLDARADVYALGAILYHLLTFRPPYEAPSTALLIAQLFRGPPKPPREVAPAGREPPAALETICLKAMARERRDRYPDARALLSEVEAWLDDRPVEAHAESPHEAFARLLRRHKPAVLAVVLTFVGLGLGALAAGLVIRDRARRADAERVRAEAAGRDAARQAAAAELAGRATRLSEEALRAALDLERQGALAAPLEALEQAHRAARGEVERRRTELRQGLLGDVGLDPAVKAELTGRVDAARRRVDRCLAQVLASRAPRRGLEPPAGGVGLGELELGEEGPTFVARAQHRLGRRRAALDGLRQSPVPRAEPLRLARAALEAVLADETPLSAQVAAVERALGTDPGAVWLHLLRAELRVRQGDRAGALADADRARALDPTDPGAGLLRLRRLLPVHTNWLLLSAEKDVVAELAPDLAPLAAAAAQVRQAGTRFFADFASLDAQGKRQGIEPALEGRIERGELDPADGALLLAEAALLTRRPAEAERWARTALEARDQDREAQGLLARALLAQGKRDEARAATDHGLTRWGDDAELAWVRGALLLQAGEVAAAVPHLRAGARVGDDPWRWEALARAHLQLGQLEEGVRAARTGLSFEPLDTPNLTLWDPPQAWDPRLQRVLGELRRAQGRHGLAALQFTRALYRALVLAAELDRPPDLSDAMRAGDALAALGLLKDAQWFWRIAASSTDPAVKAEAERRLR